MHGRRRRRQQEGKGELPKKRILRLSPLSGLGGAPLLRCQVSPCLPKLGCPPLQYMQLYLLYRQQYQYVVKVQKAKGGIVLLLLRLLPTSLFAGIRLIVWLRYYMVQQKEIVIVAEYKQCTRSQNLVNVDVLCCPNFFVKLHIICTLNIQKELEIMFQQ